MSMFDLSRPNPTDPHDSRNWKTLVIPWQVSVKRGACFQRVGTFKAKDTLAAARKAHRHLGRGVKRTYLVSHEETSASHTITPKENQSHAQHTENRASAAHAGAVDG